MQFLKRELGPDSRSFDDEEIAAAARVFQVLTSKGKIIFEKHLDRKF